MEPYVASDVSLKEISVCVVDGRGAVVFEGKSAADPAALAELIRAKADRWGDWGVSPEIRRLLHSG